MTKSIVLSFNLVFIVLISFFQKSEVEIKHNIPASLKPGAEQLVTIELDKSDVTGFAKLQFNLDEGITAEAVDAAGASFTFNNQAAKFIWMSIPQSKKITLKMRIIASAKASGSYNVATRFSYIYENERKNVDIPSHAISVGEGGEVAVDEKESFDAKSQNNSAEAAVGRTVTNTGINQWRVDVVIDRKALYGFAKVEEEFPTGYTVIDLKSSSAVFTVEDQVLKYVWYDFPDQDRVTVSYKLLPVIAMDGTQPSLKGSFSYLKNEETASLVIENGAPKNFPSSVSVKDENLVALHETKPEAGPEVEKTAEPQIPVVAAQATSATLPEAVENKPEPLPTPEKTQLPITAPAEDVKPVVKPVVKKAPKPATTTTPSVPQKSFNDGNIVDVPKPEKGVYFKVQLAAGQNNLNNEIFAKLYTFSEKFSLESHSGMYKYTTGYHQVYKAARDDRERITSKYNKFKGPFVTAYNDGERITVQEALMITSQKWYQ